MKKIATALFMFLYSIGAYTQYFNVPFYKMGFDTDQDFDSWIIKTEQVPTLGSALWHLDSEETSFDEIDRSSKQSLAFSIDGDDVCITTITSPIIPVNDRKGIVVGFSAEGMRNMTSWKNCFIYFEVSFDGQVWESLFDSSIDAYGGNRLNVDWSYYYYYLSSKYDSKNIQLRFRVDASQYSGWGDSFILDGIFVSQRYEYDAGISYLNQMIQGENTRGEALTGIFLEKQPVVVKIFNNGLYDINTVNLCYQVDEQEKVVETLTLNKPLPTGDTLLYSFKENADFVQPMKEYQIKAWVDLENEQNRSNDSIAGNVENILAAVPYVPTFSYYRMGTTYTIIDDHWTYETDPVSNTFWRYTQGTGEDYVHWDLDLSRAQADCNASLVSRPIYLEEGKGYDLYFDIETQLTSDNDSKKNKVTVYYTTDANGKENLIEIWKNETIGRTNCLNSEAKITPEKTGVYYIVFLCTSSKTADLLSMHHISVLETSAFDIKVAQILQPENIKLLYTNAETVKVKLNNHGLNDITDNVMLYMSLDDNQIAVETMSEIIGKGADLEYTFNVKADLSDVSKAHLLKVWSVWEKDTNLKNDTTSLLMTNLTTKVPYNTNFSTDEMYWEKIDNNKDGNMFVPVKTSEWSDAISLEYPGALISTDEYLYSRPLQLYAGKIYRTTYNVNVERPASGLTDIYEYNLNALLYKITDDGKQLVTELSDSIVAGFNTLQDIIHIKEDGIYVIGYHITYNNPADYYIRFTEFDIVETAENDISLKEVLIPGTQISAYHTIPLGVKVYNNGINPITEFTVKISSPTIGVKEQIFAQTIESQNSATVYLDKEITFNNATDEDLVVEVSIEDDNVLLNNSLIITINRLESLDIPLSIPFRSANGWLTINRNQDNRTFSAGSTDYSIYLTQEGKEDWLVSRSMNLSKGHTYKVAFDYQADDTYNSLPKFKVYAYNCATGELLTITTIVSNEGVSHWGSQCTYVGYMEVPSDGVYSIIFEDQKDIANNYNEVVLMNQLIVEEVADKPDLKIIAMTEPVEDKIFSEEENVTISFKNEGTLPLNSISFKCDVNDIPYYVCYQEELAAGDEASVTFGNVNLSRPDDYKLTVKPEMNTDKNPENNVLIKTLKSLPIIEMQMFSLDSPKNGKLGTEEMVTVTLQNNGKGTVTRIPVHYSIVYSESKEIIDVDEVIEASIAEGEKYQYTFTRKADMSGSGVYRVTTYVAMENDTNLHNDTLQVNIVGTHKDMDAGVVEVTTPKNGLMTNEESIGIKVKNFGEDILFDVPVKAIVIKGDNTLAEMTGIVAEIKAGEIVEYTFEQKVDMYMTGDYIITAATVLEADANPDNNEFTAVIHADKVDGGITEIISPTENCTAGEQEITVTVKNFGDVELKEIPVFFKVGTMPQTGLIKETIPAGESITYTFFTKYNFKAEREYTLIVYTELDGDMDAENNRCEKTIKPIASSIDDVNVVLTSIYPNPAKDIVTVKIADDILHSVWVYDATGKVIKVFGSIETSEYTFSVQDYIAGIYYIKIATEKGVGMHKLIVR